MKDNATIARRLASQTWGEVQTQQKVAEGIWSYSTAGHGGFVVDTNVCTKLKEFETTVYIRQGSYNYYPSEQHFAAFEEDCEYAKVIWLYPYVLKAMKKNYISAKTKTYEDFCKEHLEYAKKSLEHYNPKFLEKHPKPGSIYG